MGVVQVLLSIGFAGLSLNCTRGSILCLVCDKMKFFIRVFHSLCKIGRNGIIVFKGINNSKKVTSSGAKPDARFLLL